MTSAIALQSVRHAYDTPGGRELQLPTIEGVDLDIRDGEFVCLLGPSGCGKTTVLNIVAGFESTKAGTADIFGKPITAPGSERGVIFQSELAIFPWLTVRENVAFSQRMQGNKDTAVVDQFLRLVNLYDHADKFPRELSGGMKQRVQIARVLVMNPAVLLMDEPFGALDAETRRHLQVEFEEIWRSTRKTVLFVTHDISESVLLADRIAVMTKGPAARIAAIFTNDLPRPRSRASAGFTKLEQELSATLGSGNEEK